MSSRALTIGDFIVLFQLLLVHSMTGSSSHIMIDNDLPSDNCAAKLAMLRTIEDGSTTVPGPSISASCHYNLV